MPVILEDDPAADLEADALDAAVADAEVQRFAQPLGDVGDLSRGGRAGEVSVYPNPIRDSRGHLEARARPNVRQAWMWDGTETLLPLGWNPEGTQHDGARPYLSKKHCHCCGFSGFRYTSKLRACPQCVKNRCPRCEGGLKRSKIIPCFYFKKGDVPYPKDTTGDVDCFVESCVRRGGNGFKSVEEMLMHAAGKHRRDYQARMDRQRMEDSTELATLRMQVAALTTAQLRPGPEPVGQQPAPPRPGSGRRQSATGTPEAPLYVKG